MSLVLLLDKHQASRLLLGTLAWLDTHKGGKEYQLFRNALQTPQEEYRFETQDTHIIEAIYRKFLNISEQPYLTGADVWGKNPDVACDNVGMQIRRWNPDKIYSAVKQ